ncbi:hypothetical protein B7494_g7710 [Chlorociboria aeruginascens]|nr:hypothetical protein B7494_g7710 [Chlorociboria aeruginascens]
MPLLRLGMIEPSAVQSRYNLLMERYRELIARLGQDNIPVWVSEPGLLAEKVESYRVCLENWGNLAIVQYSLPETTDLIVLEKFDYLNSDLDRFFQILDGTKSVQGSTDQEKRERFSQILRALDLSQYLENDRPSSAVEHSPETDRLQASPRKEKRHAYLFDARELSSSVYKIPWLDHCVHDHLLSSKYHSNPEVDAASPQRLSFSLRLCCLDYLPLPELYSKLPTTTIRGTHNEIDGTPGYITLIELDPHAR